MTDLIRTDIDFDSISETFNSGDPFRHIVIDNFFLPEIAAQLAAEFPPFDGPQWSVYDNPIEIKKALNHWDRFPRTTYQAFTFLNSDEFVGKIARLAGVKLFSDPGLHGGGWHTHAAGGKLNSHLDYSIHPKVGKERILNLIVYITPDWQEPWGGELGFWKEDNGTPGELRKEIVPKFNRAVIFDTSQQSWHGLPYPVRTPKGIRRNSMAVYYLCEPREAAAARSRAQFAPTADQVGDQAVLDLIARRSQEASVQSTYRSDPHEKK